MMSIAHPLALWALHHDAQVEVVVFFAVGYALDHLALMSSTGEDAPALYRNGMPWASYTDPFRGPTVEHPTECRTAYTASDLDRLRLLPGLVARSLSASGETCLQGTWSPEGETRVHASDLMRPPVEALAVVALDAGAVEVTAFTGIVEIVPSTAVSKQVLAIGFGHQAGVQALSVMLPDASIYADAAPYHSDPIKPRAWHLLVVNVPLASAVEIAACLGSGGSEHQPTVREFGEVRARSLRKLDARIDHLGGLLGRLALHAHAGCKLVVLADPQLAGAVQGQLTDRGYRRSELAVGTRKLPALYTASEVHPEGAPPRLGRRGLPAPTGRVVTAWVCP
jgi:hypothetical protein